MIILLNGTSSSGKTSIANELRQKLPSKYFHFGLDTFLENALPKEINFENEADFEKVLRAISGFHRSLRFLAETIDYFVVDLVLDKNQSLVDVAKALDGFDTFFVGIQAPLDIIESRESKRPHRKLGTARAQFKKINSLIYDLTVDSSKCTPSAAADMIIKNLKSGTALSKNLNVL